MQEEIFGPILPMLTFDRLQEAIDFIRGREKPLALYLFTSDRAAERQVLGSCSFGGGCINDTIIHLATTHMPFGGVGHSGMGSYHGKKSFETFTHARSIVKKRPGSTCRCATTRTRKKAADGKKVHEMSVSETGSRLRGSRFALSAQKYGEAATFFTESPIDIF